LTPEQVAGVVKPSVLELSNAFSECPRTLRRARLLGLSGWAFYVTARGGALGDVPAEVAAAALGFIAPEAVAEGWEAARRAVPPAEVAACNLADCCQWGNERLAGVAGVARLAELAGRVVATADPTGMPLFAAWRAMPVPDDAPAAWAAVALHLLREYRGGAHLLAVRVSGLTPLEAVICGPDGEAAAVTYGWPPPYPPAGPLLRRWLWAEAMTDRITAQAFSVLDAAERVELVDLLAGAGRRPGGVARRRVAVIAGAGRTAGPLGGGGGRGTGPEFGHVVGRGAGLLSRGGDLREVPGGRQAALVPVEDVDPRGHLAVEGDDPHVQLAVGARRDAFDLVELGGVPGVHIVERHEDAVAGRLDDRGDRAFPAKHPLTGEGEPPAFQPAGTYHGRMRTIGSHSRGIEV
jgi:hypothetical protein